MRQSSLSSSFVSRKNTFDKPLLGQSEYSLLCFLLSLFILFVIDFSFLFSGGFVAVRGFLLGAHSAI